MRIAAVILAALFLSGCFDLTYEFDMAADKSGTFSATVTADQLIIDALEDTSFLPAKPDVLEVRRGVQGAAFYRTEKVVFEDPEAIPVSGMGVTLARTGFSLFGIGNARNTLTMVIAGTESTGMEDMDAGAATLLRGRSVRFAFALPGPVLQAQTLVFGDYDIEAEINGSNVVWTVPLDVFYEGISQIDQMTFEMVYGDG